MKNRMPITFLGWLICGLLLSSAVHSQSNIPKPTSKMVDVGSTKLWMESAGTGGPTVVLEFGLGGPPHTWDGIFPEIAKFTKVVKYHRAGYGKSNLPTTPRTFTNVATELHEMLRRENVPGPYVLAGHSLGNGFIRAFAHLFPEEVAGIVFVDPLNTRIFDLISEEEKKKDAEWVVEFIKKAPPGPKAEVEFLTTDEKDFKELRSFNKPPDVPLMLLVAGRNEGGPTWTRAVVEEYGPWIYDSAEGSLIVDPESSHYIHRDNPALVIESIRRVVFPSVYRRLSRLLRESGTDAAVAGYREMRKRYPREYFRESDLNSLGYQRLNAKDAKGAIALFKLNVEVFPNASNAYDSLGEAYMVDGQKGLAIRNYRRSLELDPINTNAAEMIKKLEVSK